MLPLLVAMTRSSATCSGQTLAAVDTTAAASAETSLADACTGFCRRRNTG